MCKILISVQIYAVQILDYYHLSENAHSFAKYKYTDNEIKMNGWAKDILDRIGKGLVEVDVIQKAAVFAGLGKKDKLINIEKHC